MGILAAENVLKVFETLWALHYDGRRRIHEFEMGKKYYLYIFFRVDDNVRAILSLEIGRYICSEILIVDDGEPIMIDKVRVARRFEDEIINCPIDCWAVRRAPKKERTLAAKTELRRAAKEMKKNPEIIGKISDPTPNDGIKTFRIYSSGHRGGSRRNDGSYSSKPVPIDTEAALAAF